MEATKPAWMLKQIGNDPNTMAIVPQGEGDSDSESQYNSDNAEDDAENFPPGPVDAEHCLAGGPGFAGQFLPNWGSPSFKLIARKAQLVGTAGGAAESPAHFYITAKDSRGTRIKDGGAYVVVTARAVGPGTTSPPVHGSVKDNKDGSYTATYTVPSRGNYEVSIYPATPKYPSPADDTNQFE